VVPHAAPSRGVARGRIAASGVVAAALWLAACGGSSKPPTAAAGPPAKAPQAKDVSCAYWRVVDRPERLSVIREIRSFAGGPVGSPSGHGAVLPEPTAYRVFDGYCAQSFATHFKLYKLYTRAAAFGGR